jgi:hypothetical protein
MAEYQDPRENQELPYGRDPRIEYPDDPDVMLRARVERKAAQALLEAIADAQYPAEALERMRQAQSTDRDNSH